MKAKFTGHDTFPLRYGWLYKAFNHLNSNGKLQTSDEQKTRDAIVKLGVGKNMVNAIRYWAEASSIIASEQKNNSILLILSDNGKYLFDTNNHAKDPYLEQPGSIWLIHFWLNFNFDYLTAYRYFFNYSNVQHFEKSKLMADCEDDAKKLITNDIVNEKTLKKDFDCFLNTYCKKYKSKSKKTITVDEDHFTSPLAELNLIQDNGGGFYISDLSERPDLPIEIFIYALIKFTQKENEESKINTIDFDSLLSKPCSPGRIFRLSESGLGQKLDEAQDFSNGEVSWIDSLGLRQVKIDHVDMNDSYHYLNKYYAVS